MGKHPLNKDIYDLASSAGIERSLVLKVILESPQAQRLLMILEYSFKNPQLFIQSLVHRSITHELPSIFLDSYEKLEFLGDSVLNLLVSTNCYFHFSSSNEGELSKLRSAIVNEESLAILARYLGLHQMMLVGKGELAELEQNESIVADGLEAVLGAIYLDAGPLAAQKSFEHLLAKYSQEFGEDFIHFDRLLEYDAKSLLQEQTMKRFKCLPEYQTKQTQEQEYEVSLFVMGQLLGQIRYQSKKKAQKLLAQEVLKKKLLDQLESDLIGEKHATGRP